LPGKADRIEQDIEIPRLPVTRRGGAQQLVDGELTRAERFLQDDADPFAVAPGRSPRIDCQHAHRARVGVAEALHGFQRGRLSGAVRAEQGEHFAAANVEVQAVESLLFAVTLGEPAYLDDVHAPTIAGDPSRPQPPNGAILRPPFGGRGMDATTLPSRRLCT